MTLATGEDAVVDKFFTFQQYNRIKNHWRQSNPLAVLVDAEEGMIASDADDDKLWHKTGDSVGWDEVLQEVNSFDAQPIFYALTLDVTESEVSDPPTDAELDALFGQPSAVGRGWFKFLSDTTSGSDKFYLITSDGTGWRFRALSLAV
jgi:hypothetical protein